MALILASSSPWKAAVLRDLGLELQTVPHAVDEASFALGDDPRDGVRRLAEAKALSVSGARAAEDCVVGVDQVAWIDGRVEGKSADAAAARALLLRMQAEVHELLAGWAVTRGDRVVASGVEVARLTMRALSAEQIDRYVALGEWSGSAGAYRIERAGRQLFEAVEGDHFTVLGMPVGSVLPVLRREGVAGTL